MIRRHLLPILLVLISQPAHSGEQYTEAIRVFEQYAAAEMTADRIPGLSAAFMKGDFVWTAGFGHADLENMTPAKAESAYRLASITKPMTAVAVMQLYERGVIDLDAEVQTYVPYFPRKRWRITVRQLLGHLGGISHYRNYDEEGHIKVHKTTREAIDIFDDFDLVAEPGTRYQYTSYGYNLLGAAIEGASGESYGDYMREHVWAPLDMTATRMDDPTDLIPNRVRGYRIIDGEIKNSEFIDISSRFAGGGTRSTVGDLLKFARGLNSEMLLSRKTIDQMYTSGVTKAERATGYGYGWAVSPTNGRFAVAHGGAQAETRTYLLILPADDAAIAVACNLESANPSKYARRLFQLVFGEPWNYEAYTRNSVDDAIYDAMRDVYNHGLAYYDRHQKAITEDGDELAAAFAYFNAAVDAGAIKSGKEAGRKKLADGSHPVSGQPFIQLGAYMAATLARANGSDHMSTYHIMGATQFFSDFVAHYKKDKTHPKRLRFEKSLEKLIRRWQEDWTKCWTPRTRQLTVGPNTDVEALEEVLAPLFSRSTIYPNYLTDLNNTHIADLTAGNADAALKVAKTTLRLYPESAAANTMLGVSYFTAGKDAEAEKLIRRAAKINPRGAAGPDGLNQTAYRLEGINRADVCLKLLKLAVTLYPNVANLYGRIGEFYLNRGERKESIRWYEKALEVDPEFENAKRILERILSE